MLRRLRRKLVLVNMGIVTLLLVLALGLIYHATQRNLEQESLRLMQSVAGFSRPGRLGDAPREVRLPCFVIRLDPGGRLEADGSEYFNLENQELLRQLVELAFSSPEPAGIADGYGLRFLRSADPRDRWVVFADLSTERATLSGLLQTCLFSGAVIFLLFFGVSIFLAHWAVKPVEAAWNQQRQFVADASHELKTPLTVIQTSAELLQNADCPPENQRRFSDNIVAMSRQMRLLVERLLELARWDSGQSQTPFGPLDFSALVKNCLLSFDAVFFERGLTITPQITGEIQVNGSQHLGQVVDILLDNAQKYASPKGQVWVTLERLPRGKCRLEVANTGPAISQEELTLIFRRFYRADKARSRDGSFGLGLSIAENLVHQHRGRIWAESENDVNRFFVELPVLTHTA